jgi:hypothetical protein
MISANLPWVESPFFNELLQAKNLNEADQKIAIEYHKNGYVVIPGLLPDTLIERVQHDSEHIGFNPDIKIKRRNEQRIQDLWLKCDSVKELACFPEIIRLLEMLYGRKALPFQTLNFRVGSQQQAHSDTIHFSSLPAKFMCGVWVALEDITIENGPVFYCPGSHRLPEYDFSQIKPDAQINDYDDYGDYEKFIGQIVDNNSLEKKTFLAKKGDVLIWSSNIIHGGSPLIKKDATRWSQVTHYFFEDCYYYTPMLSNMVTRELYLRNNLKNIRTGEDMVQSYNGEKLNAINTSKNLYILNNNLKQPKKFFSVFGKGF